VKFAEVLRAEYETGTNWEVLTAAAQFRWSCRNRILDMLEGVR